MADTENHLAPAVGLGLKAVFRGEFADRESPCGSSALMTCLTVRMQILLRAIERELGRLGPEDKGNGYDCDREVSPTHSASLPFSTALPVTGRAQMRDNGLAIRLSRGLPV